jgi:hypothetical protein
MLGHSRLMGGRRWRWIPGEHLYYPLSGLVMGHAMAGAMDGCPLLWRHSKQMEPAQLQHISANLKCVSFPMLCRIFDTCTGSADFLDALKSASVKKLIFGLGLPSTPFHSTLAFSNCELQLCLPRH